MIISWCIHHEVRMGIYWLFVAGTSVLIVEISWSSLVSKALIFPSLASSSVKTFFMTVLLDGVEVTLVKPDCCWIREEEDAVTPSPQDQSVFLNVPSTQSN